jgi:hypothetical protein
VGQLTGVIARHTYDAAGREIDQTQYFAPDTWRTYRTGNPNDPETVWIDVDISGWRSHQTVTTYDADGRVSEVDENGRPGQAGWLAGSPDPALTALSKVLYSNASGASGYDAAGRLTTYRYQHLSSAYVSTTQAYTHTYTTTYEARDTYLEKVVSGTSDNTSYKPTTTTSTYDPTGRRVAITENTPISGGDPITRLRYFSFDADGNIVTRRDGTLDGSTFTETANSRQHFTYVNGQQLAAYGEDGHLDAASQLTAFDSSDMGAEPTLVLEGDTLQSIAQRVYGNPNLWYVLAAANAVSDADLVAGTTLKAPQVKTTANDASTFKPYDPNSITGPTTPSLPYISVPPRAHCDALMTVFMVVVAVIVTVYTAGAAASAMGYGAGAAAGTTGAAAVGAGSVAATGAAALAGTYGVEAAMVAGAVGGFAGSAASQAVGSATGQTSFSWRNAFASGVAGGLTAGFATAAGSGALGETLATSRYARAAAGAVGGNLANVVGNRIAGTDIAFSWSSVAASAISAVITAGIAPKIGSAFGIDPATENGQTATSLIGGLTGGLVSAGVRDSLGEDVNYGQVVADAFGNMLGNRLSGQDALQAEMLAARIPASGTTSYAPQVHRGYGGPSVDDQEVTNLAPVTVFGSKNDPDTWSFWQWNAQADKWLNMDDGRLYAPSRDPKTVVRGWSSSPQVVGAGSLAINGFIDDLTLANRAYAAAHPTSIESLTRSLQAPSEAQIAYYQLHGRPMPNMSAVPASLLEQQERVSGTYQVLGDNAFVTSENATAGNLLRHLLKVDAAEDISRFSENMSRPIAGEYEMRGVDSYSWNMNANRFNEERSPLEIRVGTIYIDQSFASAAFDEYIDRMSDGVGYDIANVEPNFEIPENYPETMRIRDEALRAQAEGLSKAIDAVDFGVKVGQRAENYLMVEVYRDYLAGGALQFQVFDFARPAPSMPYAPRQLYVDDSKYLQIIKGLSK